MPDWTWAAASACGTAHQTIGDRRQDAFRVVAADAGYLVAIACDGAGSAIYGRYGAAITARLISARAKAWIAVHAILPTPAAIDLWVAEARLRIIVTADRIGATMSDFASTLVMAVSDGTSLVTAHIGDGVIVARCSASASLEVMSWPESGEFASTTYFITDFTPRLRIGIMHGIPIDRLAVSTDGLERLALDFAGRIPHPPFFDLMFGAVTGSAVAGRNHRLSHQLATFLGSDAVNARTDDDKTLVLTALR